MHSSALTVAFYHGTSNPSISFDTSNENRLLHQKRKKSPRERENHTAHDC
jgi:hypothetical protein